MKGRKTVKIAMKNNKFTGNLSFILCAFIFINNSAVIFLKAEINKTSFILSTLLGIMLLINGVIYKRAERSNIEELQLYMETSTRMIRQPKASCYKGWLIEQGYHARPSM